MRGNHPIADMCLLDENMPTELKIGLYSNGKSSKQHEPIIQADKTDGAEINHNEQSTTEKDFKIDDFTTMGKYAALIMLFSEFVFFAAVGNNEYMTYANATAKVTCEEYDSNINICKLNGTHYKDILNCTLKTYNNFTTVHVEFKHYCDDGNQGDLDSTEQMVILFTGKYILGSLSDRYGRKMVLVASYTAVSLFSIFLSLAHNLSVFYYIRMVLIFFTGGIFSCYNVFKFEHVPPKHRFWIATVFSYHSMNFIFSQTKVIATNWRTLQLFIVIVSSPAMVLLFFVDEPPRFLIQQGRIAEAGKVLRRMQSINKASAKSVDELEQMLLNEQRKINEKSTEEVSIHQVFSTRRICIGTIIIFTGRFINEMLYRGLFIAWLDTSNRLSVTKTMRRDVFPAVFCCISAFLEYRFRSVGRRLLYTISYIVILFSLSTILIMMGTGKEVEYPYIRPVLLLWSIAAVEQIFVIQSISTLENFPTVIRSKANAVSHMFRRFGIMFSGAYFDLPKSSLLPFAVMIVLSVFDMIAFPLAIPETKKISLPDTMEDMKNMYKKKKKSVQQG